MKTLILLFTFIFVFSVILYSQENSLNEGIVESNKWRIEGGFLVTHFQQQVKPEVGDPRGERLVNEFQLGLYLSGTYRITDYFSAGLFTRIDRGERAAGVFNGFVDGKAVTINELGGVYTEFWFGPLLQFNWKMLSAEVGYALVGLRDDDGRRDIPSTTGDNSSAFSTSNLIAWLISVGGNFPVTDNLNVVIKIQYRNRYYTERGGNPLINNIEHGTQSISPIIGIGFKF